MRFFRNRAFAAANGASLFMYFGMFGSIFLLTQFFQTAQGYSPLESGLRVLPWTAMPMIVAPIAGALSDRIGGGRIMAAGLFLQAAGLAWIASVSHGDGRIQRRFVGPFILSGIGMGMFFAPVANVVLSAVRPVEEGKASGANNAIREVGGVFGVAVLASLFSRYGGYESAETFNDGLVVATWVGAAVVAGARRSPCSSRPEARCRRGPLRTRGAGRGRLARRRLGSGRPGLTPASHVGTVAA